MADSVAEITKMAAQTGVGGLYWTAAILGMGIIVGALVLIPLRKKSPQRHLSGFRVSFFIRI
ncbi:hypothetical protein POTG_01849 [Paenibacillus sp. oral taxon 786 str. D14]|nr:hypothetical protein POTG_01849 [Paenibacillus sp. oral taxon 786 str. D14]